MTAVLEDGLFEAQQVPASPAVLLVAMGAPAVLAPSGSLLMIDPDQPLAVAVRSIVGLFPNIKQRAALQWIADGAFPASASGGAR